MERIYQKIGRIREYLSLVQSLQDDCLKRFSADPIYRGALLHYLFLMSDSCISLAELVIRRKKLRPPQTYYDAIDILGEHKILQPDFAYSFAKIAGFRNFLAHDYEKTEAEVICKDVLAKIPEVEEFLSQMEHALGIDNNE